MTGGSGVPQPTVADVVGAGIIGLSIAEQLARRHPRKSYSLERQATVAESFTEDLFGNSGLKAL
ncbi:MAG: hypothetical protein ACE5KX_06520 [Acidimicrobiia bacterium]